MIRLLNLKKSATFAVLTLLSFALLFQPIDLLYGQVLKNVSKQKTSSLSVVLTIYGIKPTTGLILAFIQANNLSNGQFLNATGIDKSDKFPGDRIIELPITLANAKIPIGGSFKACVLILNEVKVVCNSGHKSPSNRTEFVDLVV